MSAKEQQATQEPVEHQPHGGKNAMNDYLAEMSVKSKTAGSEFLSLDRAYNALSVIHF